MTNGIGNRQRIFQSFKRDFNAIGGGGGSWKLLEYSGRRPPQRGDKESYVT